ncbi:MAG: hypothetical protein DRJ56_03305 [Thermoprotei archaeon]|nr:MAG: hypothetical protein DRJ56_03305 [Thermoprotei archaeon]
MRVEATMGSVGRKWGTDLERLVLEIFREALERGRGAGRGGEVQGQGRGREGDWDQGEGGGRGCPGQGRQGLRAGDRVEG